MADQDARISNESVPAAEEVRDEAIADLARMVAGIAQKCWGNLGATYAGDIINRCGAILDSLPLPTHNDGGDGCS